MKKYIGTKQVSAEPMNLGEFIKTTGRADSWVPSVSDMFAEDWEIVL